MKYEDWIKSVPIEITGDPLWKVEVYRLALFGAEIGWRDATKLIGDKRTVGLGDQLYRALGSIAANIAEGYSRGTGKDRARFYEYSLGSARESRTWYYNGRHILGESVSQHRMQLLTQIVRLLLTMIPDQRGASVHEASPMYFSGSEQELPHTLDPQQVIALLQNVPFP